MGEFGAEYAALGFYALLATIFVVALFVAHYLRSPRPQGAATEEPFDLGAQPPASNDAPLEHAAERGADLVQMFLSNPQSWKKPVPREDADVQSHRCCAA